MLLRTVLMKQWAFLLGLFLGWLGVSYGDEPLPREGEPEPIEWVKIGQGTGHFARIIKLYEGTLYQAPDTAVADVLAARVPFRFEIRYLRKIKRADLVKAGETWFPRNLKAGADAAVLGAQLDTVHGWYSSVGKGDRYELIFTPKEGLVVAKNGEEVGVIPDAGFARAYLAIWFGDRPCNPELKKAILP